MDNPSQVRSLNGRDAAASPEAPVDVVGRIGALLRVVSGREPAGVSTTDCAKACGLPRATAHRLLVSLSEQGLIDRSTDGLWRLGPELFLLALPGSHRYDDVRHTALPVLRELSVSTGESASFSVRRGNETVCLLHEEGTFPLRSHVLREGIRFPLGVASAGIAILAFMPQPARERYLAEHDLTARYGPQHGQGEIRARLERTRELGYSTNPGLIIEGSWGMGAAVFDERSLPIGAISLTGIDSRFSDPRRTELGAQLLRAARELSRQILVR